MRFHPLIQREARGPHPSKRNHNRNVVGPRRRRRCAVAAAAGAQPACLAPRPTASALKIIAQTHLMSPGISKNMQYNPPRDRQRLAQRSGKRLRWAEGVNPADGDSLWRLHKINRDKNKLKYECVAAGESTILDSSCASEGTKRVTRSSCSKST